ncbi:hypothetical protein ACET3Z_012268 [Daucus carota]
MENKFKLKISRMFRSTLDSCRTRSLSDDVASSEQPFFFPENTHHNHHLVELFSPKPPPPRSFPSLCRPKSHENQTTLFNDFNSKPKHKKQRSKSRKNRKRNNRKFDEFFCSVAANYYGLYSSDEDEKENVVDDYETTFFSSKSMSSGSLKSSAAAYNNVVALEKMREEEDFDDDDDDELMKICSPLNGKVKDSVAVIKSSSDPYNDFRTSMVEMIVEKQIFGPKDLEKLLQCFLSLNSGAHHRVIIEVFTEILETLFSD